MPRPLLLVIAVCLAAGTAALGPASAAEPATTTTTTTTTTSTSTTTTTTTTTTTVPPTTTAPPAPAPAPAPPAPAPTAPAPTDPAPTDPPPPAPLPPPEPEIPEIDPADPTAGEIALPEDVPITDMEVPPADRGPGSYAAHAGRLVQQSLTVATAEAVSAQSAYEGAKARFVWLQSDLDGIERSITTLAADDRAGLRRLEVARTRFEQRAAEAVVRGSTDELQLLVAASGDPNEIAAAQVLLGSILDADDAAVHEYEAARASVSAELVALSEQLLETRAAFDDAREELFAARRATLDTQYNLAVFAAGSEISIQGFVFPVGEPYSFGDSFGAPRMLGSEYEHAHQGTDIMAPMGTPLYACERGIITRLGTDVLGGIKLWVKGQSGTYYYYAHLAAFADGMHEGKVVDAGDLVGYVGDTGNAKGGAPHLHFEIRPGGGAPVNPYPLLQVVSEMSRSGSDA